uniref:Reverse transcriptase zinc-binding domain-containing protein n=1 Tax=Lactuca sativa TaxID=4236 RepID=A0A9R1VM04_LACSA|nr:hypothetical protein LSAT_V11C500242570 [Lactuca sativa]
MLPCGVWAKSKLHQIEGIQYRGITLGDPEFWRKNELVKSVLRNRPMFYLSLFVAPVGVIEDLENIRRHFLWSGGSGRATVHWVTWDRMKAPTNVEGASLGSLRNLNMAMLAKWWWKFKSSLQSLWAQIVRGFIATQTDLGIASQNVG